MPTYECELEIPPTNTDGSQEPRNHPVEIDISLIRASTPPSGQFGPPEYYDPGEGPEFDIDEVRITVAYKAKVNMKERTTKDIAVVVTMTAEQFGHTFPMADDLINAALEWAADHEESFYDYD